MGSINDLRAMTNTDMLLSFEQEFAYFSLDNSRVAAVISWRQLLAGDFLEHISVQNMQTIRFYNLELIDLSPDDAKRVYEAEPVRIELFLLRHLVHEKANNVMSQEDTILPELVVPEKSRDNL